MLKSVERCVQPVVNVFGVLLSIPYDIDFITVNGDGAVYGHTALPCFDEEDKEWVNYDCEMQLLARIEISDQSDISNYIEVYG